MKAIARHWVKYGNVWRRAGEAFEIDEKDAPEMKRFAILKTEESQHSPQIAPEPQESPKRGRKRKTEPENV